MDHAQPPGHRGPAVHQGLQAGDRLVGGAGDGEAGTADEAQRGIVIAAEAVEGEADVGRVAPVDEGQAV